MSQGALVVFADPAVSNRTNWLASGVVVSGSHDFDGSTVSGLSVGFPGSTTVLGLGPGQANASSGTPRVGEGQRTASSNHLVQSTNSTLTISVVGGTDAIGVDIIDLWSGSTFTATVRDTSNAIIGTFDKLGDDNFQINDVFFVGVTETLGNIGSLEINFNLTSGGDEIGIDNVSVGSVSGSSSIPEPTSALLASLGLGVFAFRRQRKAI